VIRAGGWLTVGPSQLEESWSFIHRNIETIEEA
jgi:hypothetical protein